MQLGVVMDPIEATHFHHDSTLALLWEADKRGYTLQYFESSDLYLRDGKAYGRARALKMHQDEKAWFTFGDEQEMPLADLDMILMRKDPPFDKEYLYLTFILEAAERAGVLVVNKQQSLRDANEKVVISSFPQLCAPTLVASKTAVLKAFWQEHQDIVLKPLDAMGGHSIFRIQAKDPNATVIFENLTQYGTRHVMAQRYIPEIIKEGDKRILLICGEPVPFALARIPKAGEWRGNMAAGAKPVAQALSPRDREICATLKPFLIEKGLYFVGIDVIGDYLTEINITSPTGIRELDSQCGIDIAAQLFDQLQTLSG